MLVSEENMHFDIFSSRHINSQLGCYKHLASGGCLTTPPELAKVTANANMS